MAGRRSVGTLAAEVEKRFEPLTLPTPVRADVTTAAQNRLEAGLDTVNNVLLTMDLSRAVDREVRQKELRGRLAEAHIDLLRAAVVFAGAGLDATLKELIRGSIRSIAHSNQQAREKFESFIADHLGAPDARVERLTLARILVSPQGIQEELFARYERYLTGDSLQSASQVSGVCGALGITEREIRERVKDGSLLDDMFRARNEIVHELDLSPDGRRRRKLAAVRDFVREALEVGQVIVNAVATTAGSNGTHAPSNNTPQRSRVTTGARQGGRSPRASR